MPDQRSRSLKILSLSAQAIVSGLVAIVIFADIGLGAPSPDSTVLLFCAALLGTLGLVYYGTVHQLLGRSKLALSTAILTVITSFNVILVVISTGGLDSPFYGLWLLAIVVTGIFGRWQTIGVVVATLLYYAYSLLGQGFKTPYIRDHIVVLGITFVAAGLAEWVHSRNRKASAASSKLESLSGQLSTEQLKADAIMASIGEGVMIIDATGKIQLFNKAAQELTGWDESSAQNIDYNLVLQLKSKEDQPLAAGTDPFAESIKTAKTVVKDNIFMTTRAGRKIQLSLTVSPMSDDNQQPTAPSRYFEIFPKRRKSNARKRSSSAPPHTRCAPRSGHRGLPVAGHEPQCCHRGRARQKYLGKAHEAIGHLGELFRDLLSVTKAEEGQLADKLEAVNLAKLLQTAIDDMQFAAQKKNLTLVYQIGSQSGKAIAPLYFVAASPERLREVVMNLIDNGIKFTSQGGIKVTLEGDDKECTVSISDTGLGIAQEDIPHLFQKFTVSTAPTRAPSAVPVWVLPLPPRHRALQRTHLDRVQDRAGEFVQVSAPAPNPG